MQDRGRVRRGFGGLCQQALGRMVGQFGEPVGLAAAVVGVGAAVQDAAEQGERLGRAAAVVDPAQLSIVGIEGEPPVEGAGAFGAGVEGVGHQISDMGMARI